VGSTSKRTAHSIVMTSFPNDVKTKPTNNLHVGLTLSFFGCRKIAVPIPDDFTWEHFLLQVNDVCDSP
jgi:hypothetical protein